MSEENNPIQKLWESETAAEIDLTHLELVDRSYPGMRRWIELHKDVEHNRVTIYAYDLDAGSAPVVYVSPVDLDYVAIFLKPETLINAMLSPGFSAVEFTTYIAAGDAPVGVKLMPR